MCCWRSLRADAAADWSMIQTRLSIESSGEQERRSLLCSLKICFGHASEHVVVDLGCSYPFVMPSWGELQLDAELIS